MYVQYVQIRANTSQHTYNIRAYTYFIFAQIRAHTSDLIVEEVVSETSVESLSETTDEEKKN